MKSLEAIRASKFKQAKAKMGQVGPDIPEATIGDNGSISAEYPEANPSLSAKSGPSGALLKSIRVSNDGKLSIRAGDPAPKTKRIIGDVDLGPTEVEQNGQRGYSPVSDYLKKMKGGK